MDKKLFVSALNEVKIGLDKTGHANKKHILTITPAVEEHAVLHGAQKKDYAGENPPNCSNCGSGMNLDQGTHRNSKYWICTNSFCRSTQTYQPEWYFVGVVVPIELEDFVYRPPVTVDTQARAPQCPRCGGQMTWRVKGEFWGCMGYPRCKGSLSADAALDQMDSLAIKPPKKTSPTLNSPEVVELIKYAIVVLGNDSKAKNWLHTPKVYQLNGKSPWDVLHTEEGREKVRSLLEKLRD